MEEKLRKIKMQAYAAYLRRKMTSRDVHTWIFGCWLGQKYRDNSMEFFEWVNRYHPEIDSYWFTKDPWICDYVKSKGYKAVLESENNKEAEKIMLRAGCVVYTIGLCDITGRGFFLDGVIELNLWHGIPIKKIGYDAGVVKPPFTIKERLRNCFTQHGKVITTASSDYFAKISESCFGLPFVPVLGFPNHDALYLNRTCRITEDAEKKYPGSIKILYMPTFRDARDKGIPFRPFGQFGFNQEQVSKVLEQNNMVLLNKGHFWDKTLTDKELTPRIINIEDTPILNNMDLIRTVDILITDYSSIYFDFLFMGKPVIKSPFDFDYYIHNCRGIYMDYDSLPGQTAHDWCEVCEILASRSYANISHAEIGKYFKHIDNKASERVFDYTMAEVEKRFDKQ